MPKDFEQLEAQAPASEQEKEKPPLALSVESLDFVVEETELEQSQPNLLDEPLQSVPDTVMENEENSRNGLYNTPLAQYLARSFGLDDPTKLTMEFLTAALERSEKTLMAERSARDEQTFTNEEFEKEAEDAQAFIQSLAEMRIP